MPLITIFMDFISISLKARIAESDKLLEQLNTNIEFRLI